MRGKVHIKINYNEAGHVHGQYVTQHCKAVSRTESSDGAGNSALKNTTSYSIKSSNACALRKGKY